MTRLSDYLDGELEAAISQDLSQHLITCTECTLVVNQTKMTVELYCDAQIVELPPQVSARLHEALRAKLRPS